MDTITTEKEANNTDIRYQHRYPTTKQIAAPTRKEKTIKTKQITAEIPYEQ